MILSAVFVAAGVWAGSTRSLVTGGPPGDHLRDISLWKALGSTSLAEVEPLLLKAGVAAAAWYKNISHI